MNVRDLGIVEFALKASSTLAEEFKGDPEGELFAWLRIAQQREAMVSEAYDPSPVARHLKVVELELGLQRQVTEVIQTALGAVWAQETAHKKYLASIIRVIDPPESFLQEVKDKLARIRGKIEGLTIAGISSPNWAHRAAAQIALAIGSVAVDVPEFAKNISAMRFDAFCLLNAALEQTAVDGYRRMQQLIVLVAAGRFDIQASTLAQDNERTLSDERYHMGLFTFLANWSGPPPPPPPPSTGTTALPLATTYKPALSRASRKQLIDEIVTLQARAYGKSKTFGLEYPPDTFRKTDVELQHDPVVRALRNRVGHMADTSAFENVPPPSNVPPSSAEASSETPEDKLQKIVNELPARTLKA